MDDGWWVGDCVVISEAATEVGESAVERLGIRRSRLVNLTSRREIWRGSKQRSDTPHPHQYPHTFHDYTHPTTFIHIMATQVAGGGSTNATFRVRLTPQALIAFIDGGAG